MSKTERVIIQSEELPEGVEATLHYDVEGNDFELRQGDVALETGSWPLQNYEIVRYLDREEQARQLAAFNEHFNFSVSVSATLQIIPNGSADSFNYSELTEPVRHHRETCAVSTKPDNPFGPTEIFFDQVRQPEELLTKLISLLGGMVRDAEHAYELLYDDTEWSEKLGDIV